MDESLAQLIEEITVDAYSENTGLEMLPALRQWDGAQDVQTTTADRG